MNRRVLIRAALLTLLVSVGFSVRADIVPPVQIQITEREPGAFLVQWRTPKVLPARAVPDLVMPAGCRPRGERVFLDQPGGWLIRQSYVCPDGLDGKTIGIDYPIRNPSLTSVIRVEFLSGERFAHSLEPQELSWQIPAILVPGPAARLREASDLVVGGLKHVGTRRIHLALLTAFLLLGVMSGALRRITAFGAGQLAAVLFGVLAGRAFSPAVAETCVAVAVVFLARETFRPERPARRSDGLAAGAGFFHGLALTAFLGTGDAPSSPFPHLAFVLGMDAAMLLPALMVSGLFHLAGRRPLPPAFNRAAAYLTGTVAVASLFAAVLMPEADRVPVPTSMQLPLPGASTSAQVPGSRRLGPQSGDAPVQSFLAVEPFETRNEILFRLRDVAQEIGLDDPHLEVEAQARVIERISEWAAGAAQVEIDGQVITGFVDRAGFMTADPTGVWPRLTPVRESVAEAFVGVTLVYLTDGMPQDVRLTWHAFVAAAPVVPAAIIDPETSVTGVLQADQPRLAWRNQLLDDPIRSLAGLEVEPARLPLPLFSLALLSGAAMVMAIFFRRKERRLGLAAVRVGLALALALGTVAQVSLALPASFNRSVSTGAARRVLAGVLPIVYRGFEVRDETLAYDRLALAVTGETLTEVYLEHRKSLVMEEQGGARARVDAVEVLAVDQVESDPDGGFVADATWTVAGTVTHFGHRHFRQNRYDARVAVVPVDGMWKIRSLEVLDQERVK